MGMKPAVTLRHQSSCEWNDMQGGDRDWNGVSEGSPPAGVQGKLRETRETRWLGWQGRRGGRLLATKTAQASAGAALLHLLAPPGCATYRGREGAREASLWGRCCQKGRNHSELGKNPATRRTTTFPPAPRFRPLTDVCPRERKSRLPPGPNGLSPVYTCLLS
jgi:hypothetical protein